MTRYSEKDATRILARAIQLEDIKSEERTLGELTAIAKEIGVGEAAIMAAAAELENRKTSALAWPDMIPPPAGFALSGMGLGSVVAAVLPSIMHTPYLAWQSTGQTLALFIGAAMAMGSIESSSRGALFGFETRNLALWAGFLGSSFAVELVHGILGYPSQLWHAFVIEPLPLIAMSAIVGGLISAIRARRGGEGEQARLTSPMKARVAERMKGWIDAIMKRSRLSARTGLAGEVV
jgi:hypothetical protein